MCYKNITRYDNSFKGYRLAITRRRVTMQIYFTDANHGGRDGALNAALKTRDAFMSEWHTLASEGLATQEGFLRLSEKYSVKREKNIDKTS